MKLYASRYTHKPEYCSMSRFISRKHCSMSTFLSRYDKNSFYYFLTHTLLIRYNRSQEK